MILRIILHTTGGTGVVKTNGREELLPDVAWTWECFGFSGINTNGHIPQPRLVVSPKVFDIFRRLKIKRTFFSPVTILDK